MKNLKLRIFIPVVIVAALLLGAFVHFQSAVNNGSAKATASGYASLTPLQKRLLSGVVLSELNSGNTADLKGKPRNYFPTSDDGCPQNRGSNIKVNQNCLNLTDSDLQGRGQANNETAIAQDPNNPKHILAGDNDYRRGDSTCGAAYSLDGGQTWADSTIPISFTRGTAFGGVARQYWQASGDPSVAWDTRGNAYYSCLVFQRGPGVTNNPDQSSAIYVFRSTHNSGASWNFPGRPVVESFNTTFFPFEDKPYITVDNHTGSPFRDRVYVAYTESLPDGTVKIYESFSANYGESFSPRVLVSTTSPLCPHSVGKPGRCDVNGFPQPFTGPDGSLYVVYSNFNNAEKGPKDNRFQILLSKSTNGGKSFSAPVKVSDYYDVPDCATYQGGQDAGVSCVPEKGKSMKSVFRATNYASGAVNPLHSNQVVVTVASYINVHSKESNGCIPQGFSSFVTPLYTGVKTPGACNNDILVSVSRNGGATFTGTTTDPRQLTSINMEPGQATTDQFWQWASFSNSGRFAVSYFDRQYGRDEFNGNSDISLSGVDDPYTEFHAVRVTTSSMPVPTEFTDAQGNSLFYGDYAGLSTSDGVAHPLWMDTRSIDLFLCPGTGAPGVPPAICKGTEPNGLTANDQDIFTASVPVP